MSYSVKWREGEINSFFLKHVFIQVLYLHSQSALEFAVMHENAEWKKCNSQTEINTEVCLHRQTHKPDGRIHR